MSYNFRQTGLNDQIFNNLKYSISSAMNYVIKKMLVILVLDHDTITSVLNLNFKNETFVRLDQPSSNTKFSGRMSNFGKGNSKLIKLSVIKEKSLHRP